MTKYVYDFDEGNRTMADLLGGKGANLAEMTVMGLPCRPVSPSPPTSASRCSGERSSASTTRFYGTRRGRLPLAEHIQRMIR